MLTVLLPTPIPVFVMEEDEDDWWGGLLAPRLFRRLEEGGV